MQPILQSVTKRFASWLIKKLLQHWLSTSKPNLTLSLNLLLEMLSQQMLPLYGMVVLHTDILITLMMQAMQDQHLILLTQEFVMEQLLVIMMSPQPLQIIQLKLMPLLSSQDLFGGVVISTLLLNKLSILEDKQFSQLLLILVLLGIAMASSSGWDLPLIALIMYCFQIILTLQSKLNLIKLVFALVMKLVLETQLEQELKTHLPKMRPLNVLEMLVSHTIYNHVLNKFFNLMIRLYLLPQLITNLHGTQAVQFYGMDGHLTIFYKLSQIMSSFQLKQTLQALEFVVVKVSRVAI